VGQVVAVKVAVDFREGNTSPAKGKVDFVAVPAVFTRRLYSQRFAY
jgi:hypothetical protein